MGTAVLPAARRARRGCAIQEGVGCGKLGRACAPAARTGPGPAQTDELARQLATRPAGSGGEDYQKAASLFLDGKINEALEILSEERLKRQGADAKKLQEDTVGNWLLRGQLLGVKFDFDGAARAYGEAVEFAPGAYDAWFACSFFHKGQNHFKESRQGYEKALILARASGKDEDVATTLTTWASCTAMRTAWPRRRPRLRRH